METSSEKRYFIVHSGETLGPGAFALAFFLLQPSPVFGTSPPGCNPGLPVSLPELPASLPSGRQSRGDRGGLSEKSKSAEESESEGLGRNVFLDRAVSAWQTCHHGERSRAGPGRRGPGLGRRVVRARQGGPNGCGDAESPGLSQARVSVRGASGESRTPDRRRSRVRPTSSGGGLHFPSAELELLPRVCVCPPMVFASGSRFHEDRIHWRFVVGRTRMRGFPERIPGDGGIPASGNTPLFPVPGARPVPAGPAWAAKSDSVNVTASG